MNKTVRQENQAGHNFGSDYGGGDKVNAIIGSVIGDNNTSNIYIYSEARPMPMTSTIFPP